MGLFRRKPPEKESTPPVPPPAMDIRAYNGNSQQEGWFDANQFAYDVDIKTGLFYTVTFYSSAQYHYYSPAVTNVPYSKEVFERIPEGKKEIYIAKFGDPEAGEIATQKTLNLLLEQVDELMRRLPPEPAPRRPKNAENGLRLRLGEQVQRG